MMDGENDKEMLIKYLMKYIMCDEKEDMDEEKSSSPYLKESKTKENKEE